MRKATSAVVLFLAAAGLAGCAGQAKTLSMAGPDGKAREIVYPKGTIFGGVSRDQAAATAQILVESHNLAMTEMGGIKGASGRIESSAGRMESGLRKLDESSQRVEARTSGLVDSTRRIDEGVVKLGDSSLRIEGDTQKLLESSSRSEETSRAIVSAIEKLARQQGTGELTIFFPVGVDVIPRNSLEYQRVVNFADYLSRESHGRKVLFLSVGSASAFGDPAFNVKLAGNRAQAPMAILDKYLINTPHAFFKVYGTGETYSPKDVSMEEHQKYQHTRLIAVFETNQAPAVPEEPRQPIQPLARR